MATFSLQALAQTQITGWGYGNNRIAANTSETTLNTTNVNITTFGKLGTYTVDGVIAANPLYMPGVNVAGIGTKNVLYVATQHDVVYAFDADNPGSNALWTRDYRVNGATPISYSDPNVGDAIGIYGTPVIDPSTSYMYFVAATTESSSTVFRLHAVNISSGAEIATAVVNPSYNGTSLNVVNRSGLALADGQVWVALGSYPPGDGGTYGGLILTFNTASSGFLAQTGSFISTTSLGGVGIWQSGAAPAVDASGNVYYSTGNGHSVTWDGVGNFNESILKLTYSGGLKLSDYFTPAEWASLDGNDLDVSASGTALIPNTNLLITGGKTADVYVANSLNLGHLAANNTNLVQDFHVGTGTVAQFNDFNRIVQFAVWPQSPNGSAIVYIWPGEDYLYPYQLQNGLLNQVGTVGTKIGAGEQGASMALSANGSKTGTGIVWANLGNNVVYSGGVLHAYNAENVSQELWNSQQNSARDSMPYTGKFVLPIVVNGKVYLGGNNGQLCVFGLLNASASFTLSEGPGTLNLNPGESGNVTLTVTPQNGFTGSVAFSASGLPSGVTYSLSPATTTTSSTLNITAAAGVASGTYPITITGTSGSITKTTTLSLVVSPPATPDFSLSVNPAFLVVAPGGTAAATVTITPSNGFSGAVGLTASGLPGGVSASFNAASSTTATLTISAASAAALGQATLTVSGVSGSLNHSFSLFLNVGVTTVLTDGCLFITNAAAAAGSYPLSLAYSGFSAGCDMYVASTTLDLNLTGNTALNTRTLNVAGPASGSFTSGGFTTPAPAYNAPVVPDPLAFITAPTLGSCTANATMVTTSSTLSPGTYCGGLTISGGTVTLNPGLYVVTGPLTFSGGANVSGSGVSFYLTHNSSNGFGPLTFQSATVNLTAPAPSDTAGIPGIVFFGDRNWVQAGAQGVKVNASVVSTDGFWYFAHTGVANNSSTIKSPDYGGMVVDNLAGSAATFSFPLADNSGDFGAGSTAIQAQSITFPTVPAQSVGATAALSATATSGLPVTFASSTPVVCAVNGTTATFSAAGTCTLTAAQAGNSSYSAAATISQNVAVGERTQSISFTAIPAQSVGATATLSASATSGLAVAFASSTPTVCAVNGSTATFSAAGSCTLTATQAGNGTYAAAPAVVQVVTVGGRAQTISFTPVPAQLIGTAATLSASATSGLPVAFASATPAVCTVSGTTATFNAAGTCTLTATQAGNGTYAAAPTVAQNVAVSGRAQTINFTSVPAQSTGATATLSASASSGLPVAFASTTQGVCTVSGKTASFNAAGTCTLTATQAGNGTYSAAPSVSQNVAVTSSVFNTGCVFVTNPAAASGSYPVALSSSSWNAGCDMYVNSTTQDLKLTANAALRTRTLHVAGPASGSSTGAGFTSPAPIFNSAAVNDPLSSIPAPTVGGCNFNSTKVTKTTTLSPGTYCGGLVISGGTITLNPGLYVITGPLTISNGATVNGTGITFYLTQSGTTGFGPLTIQSATVNLHAPTASATEGIAGIVFFGDRNWNQTGSQGVTVAASYVTADGFWYFAHTGLSNTASTIKAVNYGGLVVDNVAGSAATFTFPLANNSIVF